MRGEQAAAVIGRVQNNGDRVWTRRRPLKVSGYPYTRRKIGKKSKAVVRENHGRIQTRGEEYGGITPGSQKL